MLLVHQLHNTLFIFIAETMFDISASVTYKSAVDPSIRDPTSSVAV